MNYIQSMILGLVQGLTEFLPVSSSGHLVLVQKLMGLSETSMKQAVSYDVALHFATLIAVISVMWRDVLEMIKKPFSKLTIYVVVATIPALFFGFIFKDIIESVFGSGKTLGIEFLITGLILLYADGVKSKGKNLDEMKLSDAGIIGLAQAIAILPAISRSGLTLAGGLFRGLNREFAIRFSFLMSIPAILAPSAYDALKMMKNDPSVAGGFPMDITLVGMLVAAVSGYFSVKFMLKIFSKSSFKPFCFYVFALGIYVIVDQLTPGGFF